MNSPVILSFLSLKESRILEWSWGSNLLTEFLAIFKHGLLPENKSTWIDPIQTNSQVLFESFIEFVNANSNSLPKEIRSFQDFLKSFPKNHLFLIVIGKIGSTEELAQYYDRLREIHCKKVIFVDKVTYSNGALALLKIYNLGFYGHQRRLVGVQGTERRNRICRFCGGQNGHNDEKGNFISFRNKAHVIPESLGNKKLISVDECDNCNAEFGRGIEQSLIEYFSFFRAFNEIKGKGGKKKLVGKNFVFNPDKGLEIKYPGNIDENMETLKIRLETNSAFIPQDVYRSLVKSVINVIDDSELVAFKRTIEWVNGSRSARFLPKIMIAQSDDLRVNETMLVISKRKVSDYNFPYIVGEFRYADISLCFVVPFSNYDNRTFVKKPDFQRFWQIFEQRRSGIYWTEMSFSSNRPRRTTINFKLDGLKYGENYFHQKSTGANQ